MKNQPQERSQIRVETNDNGYEQFSSPMLLWQTKTPQQTTESLAPGFTDEERSIALQTIIQHMIQLYGYEATRNSFLVSLFNHTLTIECPEHTK